MIKKILVPMFILASLLFSADSVAEKEVRLKKQIQKEIEREKKFAKEQTFYQADSYNFKDAEVNEESLKSIPEMEVDDLDMDSVYD